MWEDQIFALARWNGLEYGADVSFQVYGAVKTILALGQVSRRGGNVNLLPGEGVLLGEEHAGKAFGAAR